MRRTGAPLAAKRMPALALACLLCTGAAAGPAPRALILDLTSDNIVYTAADSLALPPGTDHFRIRYDSAPADDAEPARFEYRLDGVDRHWMAAGTRRATSYTNIGPGAYTFRVRAAADGAPGPEAFLPLYVAPTFTQSLSFRLACGAAALLAGALAYRYRVRHVTGRLADRLQVRTAERDREARALHDTFLQTVQGLVLRVDAVAASMPADDGARRQLEQVLDDAGAAIGAARDQLQALRAGDVAVLELMLELALADALVRRQAAPHERNIQRGAGGTTRPAIDLRVDGRRRRVAPVVADDIAAIARAALHLAWTRADAGCIRIVLTYRHHALILRVADDGRGAQFGAHPGPASDAGLAALETRAAHIGARLAIDAHPRRGTTLMLTVPAVRAYVAETADDGGIT